jgi:hypothetical protein
MRPEWEPEELVACWTLVDADWELVANKAGATRLGFALLLKFFELEAHFPRDRGELPRAAADYVAGQVGVAPAALAGYDWAGRSIKYQRARVREALGFRESTVADERRWARWLRDEVCPVELNACATRCCGDAAAIGSSRRAARASIGCSARPVPGATPSARLGPWRGSRTARSSGSSGSSARRPARRSVAAPACSPS